jgi:hypothetical protein
MRQRLGSHLTFANVVSVIALFVALGGTALASVIITSNSQVAKNTISGHHPPSGGHPNIIGGSVNRTDLATGLKESLKLHCPSDLQKAGDICFEPSTRSADTFVNALTSCARAQRRLPSDAELALVFEHSGAPQSDQWVDSHVLDPNGSFAFALSENSSRRISLRGGADDVPRVYRCVISPTN